MTDRALRAFAADPARAAILLDFDGTLSPIVERPEDAAIVPGAREVLASLVERFLVVAVVSGRPRGPLEELVGVAGVRYEGLYGLTGISGVPPATLGEVEAVARGIEGARVEPKGMTVAVHYRGAVDRADARDRLAPVLGELATRHGYDLLEGKMVFELAPSGESRKGGAIRRIVHETGARAALYAGDDLPDLEAFAALDELASDGLATVKVAVTGAETPEELKAAAHVVAESPSELLDLLGRLGA